MSANDFQTKYSSVMESMLKSAVAETTKLFETMVDELKAELCRMKKENEDLKMRCSQFENERRQPAVYTGETEPLPGPSNGSQKRDRAVQCDLVPFRTVLVEQCQPLRHPLQNENQHCGSEQMEYSLQDHTYGEGTTQMAFILVKQEASYDDSCPEPILKQEEAEPTVVCELVLSSPQASVCRTENKGSLINQEYSTEALPFPQTDEDADVTLELPHLGMDSCLQGVQNQSSELENSLVISLAVVKDNMEEESAVSQISEMQGELIASDKQPLVVAQHQPEFESLEKEQLSVIDQQCQIEGVTSVNDQADVSQQQYTDVQSKELQLAQPTPLGKGEACEGLKSGVAKDGASFQPQPEITIQPRRGRPPKKAKQLQQSRKENGSPAVSVAFLSKRCSSEKQKLSESQQISLETKKGAVQASSEGSSATVAIDTCTVESRERRTSVTLQDAMLLVEAMNQSTVENTLSPPQRVAAQLKIQCAPCVGTLETVEEVPHEPQTPPISVKSVEAAGSLPITELSATCQSNIEKVGAAPVAADAPPTNERPTQVKVVIVKQLHTAAQSSTTTPSMPSSTAAVQKKLQSVQQRSPGPLITSVAPDNAISDNTSRSASSLIHHKIAALSPTQLPTVVSTVAAQKESIPPDSATAGMPLETPSLSSVPQKEIFVASGKLLPVVHSQLSATSTGLHSGPPPRPQITIIVPRKMPASRKQNIVRTTLPVSTKSAAPVTVSSPQLISSSQETSIYTQTVLDEVASLSSPRKDQTTNNMESPKQTAAVLESINGPTETCSSLNMSVGPVPTSMLPATVDQKLCAVVRLTRLPFPVSAKGVILISKLPPGGFSESQSIVIEGTTQEKLSSMIKTEESSEALMLSSDFSPNLKETSVASSNSDGEIISFDCASPNDPPIEGQSATVTTKDKSDPHKQMSKAQFMAQLAVTPVTQDPEEASPIESVDALASCAEMSTSEKKRLQKKSLVAQLRCHLKTRLQARRTKINPEPCTETEPSTVNPKKQRLENESPNNNNSTTGPSPLSLKYPEAVVSSPKKTSNDPAPISPRRSGVGPNKNFCELSYVRVKPTRKSTPVSPNFGPDGVCSKTKKSASVSPRRSTPVKESASPKKKNSASMSSRRSNSTTQSASSKKTNNISVSTRKISSTRDGASPKNGARSKSTKNTPVSPKRTSSGAIPKKTKSSVSPRTSSLSKNGTSPKVSTIESTSFCRRRCTLTKNGSSSKQTKDSNSFSPRYSTTTHGSSAKNTKSETVSPSVSRRKTRESTPAKKPRLIQDSASPKQTLTIIDAKKLTKVAKVNVIAKMKNSSRSKLQNEGAMGQLAASHTSCEAGRKFTAKAVWTPPRLSASKTPPAVSKKEASPPRSQDSVFIYPPSVSLRPIPVRAPPVVSPLQPLSVIGRRLLKNQCGECGRVLSSVAALESHVSLHAGRRPFSCTLCGKRFPDSKGLKRHGRVHRNGRIHICQQCGKGFVYRFGLTKHLQMVHRKIKPFICQICNKGFFTKRDVEAHIRIHTGEKPFHCNLCEKKFARRVELNVHLRWHNGEKRHWCPYCGKGFLDFNNLKRHKYIHTGEKPHSCPHCAKNFTQSGHLKKHVKNVHKIV